MKEWGYDMRHVGGRREMNNTVLMGKSKEKGLLGTAKSRW